MPSATRPGGGDIVIWDGESPSGDPIYWVRRHGRGSSTPLFDGSDAWSHAWGAAGALSGGQRRIWQRHNDGRLELLLDPAPQASTAIINDLE